MVATACWTRRAGVCPGAVRREPREKLSVTLEPTVIGGVKTFVLTPKEIPRSIGPVKL